MSESTWDDPRITAYVLGELSAEEQAAFESELESDSALAAAVEEARGVTGQLQALYASESTPPLDSDRRDAIVGRGTGVTLPPAANSWRVPALVLAAAAVLLLLVGVAPWLRQQDAGVAMEQSERLDRPPVEGIGALESNHRQSDSLSAAVNTKRDSSRSNSRSWHANADEIAARVHRCLVRRHRLTRRSVEQPCRQKNHCSSAAPASCPRSARQVLSNSAPQARSRARMRRSPHDSRPVAAEVAEALRTSRARVEQAAPSAPAPASAADSLGLADLKRKAAGVDHAPSPRARRSG